ncbi:MAG: curli-like amyloid fiber formation chaperone CsgH [Candidatus Devosia phytovorans]|uniref:Curli-like amyloid fiber formation chaperone CsgH n=1 Tax=Candidatus Devosia phytovorans TaxID=3121372 RepID=A0AAJ6B1N7_9HYPH|nr:curli-like amyloid fiber formation chaperone CsgH [Devosia sp.]WEK05544.1 MAG: curli-like amyloid fiber formation chaperone CsgH [Devosia sp.]
MSISTRTGTVALGLILAAIAATAGMANSGTASSGVECGIVRTSQGGMQQLQATILSPKAVSGEYRLTIQSASNGGSSNISQSGEFVARANEQTTLASVTVTAGARSTVTFELTANGKKYDCSQDLVRQL